LKHANGIVDPQADAYTSRRLPSRIRTEVAVIMAPNFAEAFDCTSITVRAIAAHADITGVAIARGERVNSIAVGSSAIGEVASRERRRSEDEK